MHLNPGPESNSNLRGGMVDSVDIEPPSPWDEVFSEPSVIDNIDEQWNIFCKRYYEAEKICVPVRRLKTGRKRFAVPMYGNTLAKRRRKKNSMWKKYIESQKGQIYVEYRRCSAG